MSAAASQQERTSDDSGTILLDYSLPLSQQVRTAMFPSSMTGGVASTETVAPVGVNRYGFRSNHQRRDGSASGGGSPSLVPLATYFFLGLNVALFLLYRFRRVAVTTVALNGTVVSNGDLGRAMTGSLAHFEPWHLFLNMTTARSIGGDLLEGRLGTVPLVLYTLSWIPVTTTVVVGLYVLYHHCRWRRRRAGASNHATVASVMPNMVGFSGILFVWMVLATLQARNQQSCPIFFFPGLCFETFSVLGMFPINLGPVVQLIFLQVILPRASFAGHLAGLVVGFVWHWLLQWDHVSNRALLLEWTQPCILYPTFWGMGKYLTAFKYFRNNDSDATASNGIALGGGQTLGGGGAGRSRLLWTLGENQPDDDAEHHSSHHQNDSIATIRCLTFLRNIMIVHTALLAFLFGTGFFNSMILSQCLILLILTAILKTIGTDNDMVGMLGRGLVVMVLIAAVTDIMTLAGWAITNAMWQQQHWLQFHFLWAVRLLGIWGLSLALVCYMLEVQDELQQQPPSVWYHGLHWWVLQPCTAAGKTIVQKISTRQMNGYSETRMTQQKDGAASTSSGQGRRGQTVSDVV
jgi:hypothetical protein